MKFIRNPYNSDCDIKSTLRKLNFTWKKISKMVDLVTFHRFR